MLRDPIVVSPVHWKTYQIGNALPHLDMDKLVLYVDASTLGYGKLCVGTFDLFYPYPSVETLIKPCKR